MALVASCGGDDGDSNGDTADPTAVSGSPDPSTTVPSSEPDDTALDAGSDDAGSGDAGSGDAIAPILLALNFGVPGSDAVAVPHFQDAAALAAEEINAQGGIDGAPVQFEVVHTPLDPNEALTAINLSYSKSPTAILGAVSSAQVLAAARTIQDAGVPFLHWSASDNLARGGEGGTDWSFRIRPSNESLTRAVAQFVAEDLGAERVGIIYHDSEYGTTGTAALEEHFAALEVVVDVARGHAVDATDLTGDVLEMANVDVIVAWTLPNQVALLTNTLRDNGLAIPVVTSESGSIALRQGLIEPVPESGVYTVAQCDPVIEQTPFAQRFEAEFGYPADGNAATAYDAFHMLASVIEAVGTAPEAIRDGLEALEYTGECGMYRGEPDTHDLAPDTGSIIAWTEANSGSVARSWP